ncbi:MAG: DUF4352 domain-containing protein [Ruminococcus sp.]|nr:DUF4352 domain-containing protein [Ruminococcus sp.]
MRSSRIAALLAAAALALAAAAGCSSTKSNSSLAQLPATPVATQNGLAEKEIQAAITEPVDEHDTIFQINSVIDSGMKSDDGLKYVYLDVTIKNTSAVYYRIDVLNNFFVILPDNSELGFDIRTQVYACNNFKGYTETPFTIDPGQEFRGYIGGFLLDENVSEFTVCFFPTANDMHDKSSVIKCKVNAADMIAPPADFIG